MNPNAPQPVTQLIDAAVAGDAQASSQLIRAVYDDLRALASQHLAHEKPGQTLQATALVHEAYMRLVGKDNRHADVQWNGRGHFYAAAGIAMRRILVERARAVAGPKRGGGRKREELSEAAAITSEGVPSSVDWLALDEALEDLSAEEPRLAELVTLRFFAGLSFEAAAEVMGISARTAIRDWKYAKAWLYEHMTGTKDDEGET